jgi:tRNA-Thr(GGU) m(6)t(6)A37 methyltransferase TsaA
LIVKESGGECLDKGHSFWAIGHVENPFNDPISSRILRAADSKIILKPECVPGLTDMEAGQRLLVVFVFHRSQDYEWLQHPKGNRSRPKRGVFTLRSPRRPNPIGISEVDLVSIEDNILHVRGLDALNGTPVLDLKPVV